MDLRQAIDLLGSQPSHELSRAKAASSLKREAEVIFTKPATKTLQLEPGEDELSAEELALLASDETHELAKIFENGELVAVGTHWLRGARNE